MVNNQDGQTPWYLKGGLKDWAIIVGAIGFFYLNVVGSNAAQQARQETISSDLGEIKMVIKDQAKESKITIKELEMRMTQYELKLELLRQEVEASRKN